MARIFFSEPPKGRPGLPRLLKATIPAAHRRHPAANVAQPAPTALPEPAFADQRKVSPAFSAKLDAYHD